MKVRRFLPLLAAAGAYWYLRNVYRFRNPVRFNSTTTDNTAFSPADGLVNFVSKINLGKVAVYGQAQSLSAEDLVGLPASDGWLIGLYLGPLDARYTYHPVSGQISEMRQQDSSLNRPLMPVSAALAQLINQPANLLGALGAIQNERLSLSTQTAEGQVSVAMVADMAGLNAVAYANQGDTVQAGYKSAFLPEGGLILVHLPPQWIPQVSIGERVLGAQTILAKI